MSTEILLMSAFFAFIILLFIAGMFLFPQVFGISKKDDSTKVAQKNNDVR